MTIAHAAMVTVVALTEIRSRNVGLGHIAVTYRRLNYFAGASESERMVAARRFEEGRQMDDSGTCIGFPEQRLDLWGLPWAFVLHGSV